MIGVLSAKLGMRDSAFLVPFALGFLLVILGYGQMFPTLVSCPPVGTVGSCFRSYVLDLLAVLIGGVIILITAIVVVRKFIGLK